MSKREFVGVNFTHRFRYVNDVHRCSIVKVVSCLNCVKLYICVSAIPIELGLIIESRIESIAKQHKWSYILYFI